MRGAGLGGRHAANHLGAVRNRLCVCRWVGWSNTRDRMTGEKRTEEIKGGGGELGRVEKRKEKRDAVTTGRERERERFREYWLQRNETKRK